MREWLRLQAALFLVCLVTYAGATVQVHRYDAGVTRTAFTLQGSIPLPVLRFTPTSAPLNVVAVIVHGYSANKTMMSSLAVDLAKQGITVYTYDLPGHGASTVPYGGSPHTDVVGQLVTTVGEMTDYALAHAPGPHAQVVLIGYSLGTIAVGEYALQHPHLANLSATVLISGILQDLPTQANPRNLLVLSGQFDLPGINFISRHLVAAGCGVPASQVTASYHCVTLDGKNFRQRHVLAGLDHISIVTAASTHTAILDWLGSHVDTHIGTVPVNADVRLHWMLLGFLAAWLGMFPLLALGSAALRLLPGRSMESVAAGRARTGDSALPPDQVGQIGQTGQPDRADRARINLGALVFVGALAGALVLLHLWLPPSFWALPPIPFLAQQVSADVATFFLLAGIILWTALWLSRPLRPSLLRALRTGTATTITQVVLALLVVLFLYLTLGTLSSYAWESFMLTPARAWRAGVYVMMLWPFVFGRQVLMTIAPGRKLSWYALAELTGTLLVIASLIVAIATNFVRLSYLGILLPVFAIVLLGGVVFNTWARVVVKAPVWLLATTETLILAWALAATLPLIA